MSNSIFLPYGAFFNNKNKPFVRVICYATYNSLILSNFPPSVQFFCQSPDAHLHLPTAHCPSYNHQSLVKCRAGGVPSTAHYGTHNGGMTGSPLTQVEFTSVINIISFGPGGLHALPFLAFAFRNHGWTLIIHYIQCLQYILLKTMCLVSTLIKTLRIQKGFNFFTETGTF